MPLGCNSDTMPSIGHAVVVSEDASSNVMPDAWNYDTISEVEWTMKFYQAVFSPSRHGDINVTGNESTGSGCSMFNRNVHEAMLSPRHWYTDGATAMMGNNLRIVNTGGFPLNMEPCQGDSKTNVCEYTDTSERRTGSALPVAIASARDDGFDVRIDSMPGNTRCAAANSERKNQDISGVYGLVGRVDNASMERRHKCEICAKSFKQLCHLKAHRLFHTGDKPHHCDRCDRSFTQKCDLIKHYHTHTGSRRYRCHICDKAFTQNSHLQKHHRTHTGEKPYRCDVCDRSYKRKSQLTMHYRVHTRGDKPYCCTTYSKSLANQIARVRQCRTHAGEKR